MKLLTAELRAQLPPLYGQEKVADKIVYAKFFCPWNQWTLFVTEGSPEDEDNDFRFLGYVIGHKAEWGYSLLSELESIRSPEGLTIERDLLFKPGPLSEVIPFRKERFSEARTRFYAQRRS
jgi:Protein of unknown function (DUF2958)